MMAADSTCGDQDCGTGEATGNCSTNTLSSAQDRRRATLLGEVAQSLADELPRDAVTVKMDPNEGGMFAVAKRDLFRGDEVLQCHAVGIAIDTPHRRRRCAFCACTIESSSDEMSQSCSQCSIVSFCRRCKSAGADAWHDKSGECSALKALVTSIAYMSGSVNGSAECEDLRNLADQVDSLYILTVRLICRRFYDTACRESETARKRGISVGETNCSAQHTNSSKKARISESGDNVCGAAVANAAVDNDSVRQSEFFNLHMGAINWDMFDTLYTEEQTLEQSAVLENLCELIRCKLGKLGFSATVRSDEFFTKELFENVLGKCSSCSHAITDLTLPLGTQCLGRALFWSHSFYNHSCAPNAFLSCVIGDLSQTKCVVEDRIDQENRKQQLDSTTEKKHRCALLARVYCMKDVKAGDAVTLSYIPTSGLDRAERQRRLYQGYGFECGCTACTITDGTDAPIWESALKVPNGGDIDALREVQFSCNQTLLQMPRNGRNADEENSLSSCLGMIRMTSNGIRNQGIPSSHEVCIEKHRLMASALSLSGEATEALESHRHFFENVVEELFDPTALVSQNLAFADDLATECKFNESLCAAAEALTLARTVLGPDHEFAAVAAKKWAKMKGQV